MLRSWDEATPPAVKHPADIVAQGHASGLGLGVPSSARTRSGCREHDLLSPHRLQSITVLLVLNIQHSRIRGSAETRATPRSLHPVLPTVASARRRPT